MEVWKPIHRFITCLLIGLNLSYYPISAMDGLRLFLIGCTWILSLSSYKLSIRKLNVSSGQWKIINFFGHQRKISAEQSVTDEAPLLDTETVLTSGYYTISKPKTMSWTYDKHFFHDWLTPKYPRYLSWHIYLYMIEKNNKCFAACVWNKEKGNL